VSRAGRDAADGVGSRATAYTVSILLFPVALAVTEYLSKADIVRAFRSPPSPGVLTKFGIHRLRNLIFSLLDRMGLCVSV
jgi:hypothetical protein